LFAPLVETYDAARVARWRVHADAITRAIDTSAWDGAWYRRATYDDGTWLGSRDNDECRIDSIAQSWAVLSGAGDPARARQAMASVEQHLIRTDSEIALLFTPPFDQTSHDPGYIKGYPPGLRENGGQYSHAAMWLIMAHAEMGAADKAAALLHLLNPINHANDFTKVRRYKVEPYVLAADVYSAAPHEGRGGWTWYTGSAAWMYRAGVESLLGIRREGDVLVLRPRLPASWPGFEVDVTLGEARYEVVVERSDGELAAELDGTSIGAGEDGARIAVTAGTHRVRLRMRGT
jgi:cyclic beta-1,2-glucan synthetase